MSISLRDTRYEILEQIWEQENSKTEPYEKAKSEFIKNKILNDSDYLKDREIYLKLKEEGYLEYLEESNYDLDFVTSGMTIYKDDKFYFVQETEEYCSRIDRKFLYSTGSYRRYEDLFTEEEIEYIENLDLEMRKIYDAYGELKDRMDDCKSFAELASIPEISNFFDKNNPKKFNKKAKLKENVVNV